MADPDETIEARLAQTVEELAVSRAETQVSRSETAVARSETALSRAETALSRRETEAALVQVENLEVALKTARVIGMAMGILMAQRGLSEAAAFELLTDTSQRQNRKLRHVAEHVALTGALPT